MRFLSISFLSVFVLSLGPVLANASEGDLPVMAKPHKEAFKVKEALCEGLDKAECKIKMQELKKIRQERREAIQEINEETRQKMDALKK